MKTKLQPVMTAAKLKQVLEVVQRSWYRLTFERGNTLKLW